MIETKYIAGLVQGWLNDNNLGKEFVVYADTGEIVEACRCKTDYVTNCVLQESSQTLIPIKDLVLETISANLSVFVDKEIVGEEIINGNKQSRNLTDIKGILYGVVQSYNGKTTTTSIGGKNYDTTITFGSIVDGLETSIGDIDDGIWINVDINFVFFENGVNTNDCHIIIDGEDVFFTRCVISRIKTTDNSHFVGEDGSKAYVLTSGRSIDLAVPALSTQLGETIMGEVLGNNVNEKHLIVVATPFNINPGYAYQEDVVYEMVFGNTSASMDNSANVGFNISLVEASDICEFKSGYFNDWTPFNVSGSQIIEFFGKKRVYRIDESVNLPDLVGKFIYVENSVELINMKGIYKEF